MSKREQKKRVFSDIPPSGIRSGNNTWAGESVNSIETNKRSKQQHRKTVIQKKPKLQSNLCAGFDSDPKFVTVIEDGVTVNGSGEDINSSETIAGRKLLKNRLFESGFFSDDLQQNNSTLNSPMKLFDSPNAGRWDNYEKSLEIPEEDETPMFSSDQIVRSPEFQAGFSNAVEARTYPGPAGLKKRNLTVSEIFLSAKWVKPVALKYNMSSDNLPGKSTQPAIRSKYLHPQVPNDKSKRRNLAPSETSFSSKRVKPVASKYNRSCDNPPGKSTQRATRSKYSHLQVQNDKYKRFDSPQKKSAVSDLRSLSDEPNIYEHHVTLRKIVKPLRERYSQNVNVSPDVASTLAKCSAWNFDEILEIEELPENGTQNLKKSRFSLLRSNESDEPWV